MSKGQCVEGKRADDKIGKMRTVYFPNLDITMSLRFSFSLSLAKVFPGKLHLFNEQFTPQMSDHTSKEFSTVANRIVQTVRHWRTPPMRLYSPYPGGLSMKHFGLGKQLTKLQDVRFEIEI